MHAVIFAANHSENSEIQEREWPGLLVSVFDRAAVGAGRGDGDRLAGGDRVERGGDVVVRGLDVGEAGRRGVGGGGPIERKARAGGPAPVGGRRAHVGGGGGGRGGRGGSGRGG